MSELQVNNIQPTSGQALTIKDEGGTASITVATNGEATFAENIIIGTAGKGITFSSTNTPAQQSGTGTDNTLDDYEYGTFDATCSNSVTLHSNNNRLSYLKIGRQVTVSGQVRVNSDNSNSDFQINNLPFVCMGSGAVENDSFFVGACRVYGWNLSDTCKWVICEVDNGTNDANFIQSFDDAGVSSISATSNAYIMFTVTYFTV